MVSFLFRRCFDASTIRSNQANDIVHELGHGLLGHSPTVAMDELGCRHWDQEMEDEADWLSSVLLVPEEAALFIVRRGWSTDNRYDRVDEARLDQT